jgi:hypothetical protein
LFCETLKSDFKNYIMKQIITFSRRSDPAFFMDDFISRLDEKFCDPPNPYSGRPYRVSLSPEDVLLITFWTKDPRPVLDKIGEISSRGFQSAFFISVTGYPRYLEQNVPDAEMIFPAIRELAGKISSRAIWWRYDPVIITKKLSDGWHLENFTGLCKKWRGLTHRVIFSLAHIDGPYAVCRRRISDACASADDELLMIPCSDPSYREFYRKAVDLLTALGEVAGSFGIEPEVCCSPRLAEDDRLMITQGSCLSKKYIEAIVHEMPELKIRGTRKGSGINKYGYADCTCLESRDIGVYRTCRHGCVYCYADRRL